MKKKLISLLQRKRHIVALSTILMTFIVMSCLFIDSVRVYMAGMFSLGFQICCQQSFMALGQAKVSLIMACLRKLILLIPLIFILPLFISNKVFAVFLAEPVSDIIAAVVTTSVFMVKFKKLLVEDNS